MKTLFAAIALCLVAVTAAAQDPTGSIEGAVTDSTSSALAGARVTARNLDTGFVREATSGANGYYRLLLLPIGR